MSKKFNASSVMILIVALCSCAAGVLFQLVGGRFGKVNADYYNPIVAWSLIGCVAVAAVLMLCKLHGLASAVVTAVPGVSLCVFFMGMGKRAAYWHIVDVFMGIDESAFDPNYLIFVILLFVAFFLGEIAIYMRKPGQVKA